MGAHKDFSNWTNVGDLIVDSGIIQDVITHEAADTQAAAGMAVTSVDRSWVRSGGEHLPDWTRFAEIIVESVLMEGMCDPGYSCN